MRKYYFILYLIQTVYFNAYTQEQIPIGTWRNHSSYNRAVLLEKVEERIFCVVDHGLFTYDIRDGAMKKISKIDGLSDVTITAIKYNQYEKTIALGYDNGNIDLIHGQEINNVDEFKNLEIIYSKKILDIAFHQNFIYFVAEFGVLVYNSNQNVIKESWQNLGETGDFLEIRNAAILNDTIFLATESGIIAGSLDPTENLLDFRNWRRYSIDDGIPSLNSSIVESFNQQLYTVQQDNILYLYSGGIFIQHPFTFTTPIRSINAYEEDIVIVQSDQIVTINKTDEFQILRNNQWLNPRYGLVSDNTLWVADYLNGLIRKSQEGSEIMFPNGPFSNKINTMYNQDDKMIVAPGGYDDGFNPLRNEDGFYYFNDGTWINFNNSGNKGSVTIPVIKDLIDISFSKATGSVYFASFGYGIMEWIQENNFIIYNENTPGSTLVNSNPPGRNTMVSTLSTDSDENTWIANYNSIASLHRFSGNTQWEDFDLILYASRYIFKMVISQNGNKWMLINPDLGGGGILVYNEIENIIRYLTTEKGEGGLPGNTVLDIIEDRSGHIWIATTNGIGYFLFPDDILNGEKVDVILPVYNLGVLFSGEQVNCIEVDGANRKWIGTSQGAWLFNENGNGLLEHFNEGNSPLLSNQMIDIEVNDLSGEIFFGTDKGIISFRGDATKPTDSHSIIKIFPNPVTPDFEGYVGIEGLPQEAILKITDVSGKLIYQVRSAGGTATWNVRDYQGRRASTGIYLVFSSTEDGEDTYIGKIAVIN